MAIKVMVVYDHEDERDDALKVGEEIQDEIIPHSPETVTKEVILMNSTILQESFR